MGHIPVLAKEVIEALNIEAGKIYIDGTLGQGGHSGLILDALKNTGHLYSFDQDINAIQNVLNNAESLIKGNTCFARLPPFFMDPTTQNFVLQRVPNSKPHPNWTLVHDNFSQIYEYASEHNIKINGGILLDLGLSSVQLDDPKRGFSFNSETPLDMRLNPEAELTADRVINFYPEKEIADILFKFGEERLSRHIAKAIINRRPIKSCKELGDIIKSIYARGANGKSFKIHPATRSFQALRIYVNGELDVLESILELDFTVLSPGTRIAIISFHSLEDRIVKNAFRNLAKENKIKILTNKPIIATDEEENFNPRSRSAKMRVAEIC